MEIGLHDPRFNDLTQCLKIKLVEAERIDRREDKIGTVRISRANGEEQMLVPQFVLPNLTRAASRPLLAGNYFNRLQ